MRTARLSPSSDCCCSLQPSLELESDHSRARSQPLKLKPPQYNGQVRRNCARAQNNRKVMQCKQVNKLANDLCFFVPLPRPLCAQLCPKPKRAGASNRKCSGDLIVRRASERAEKVIFLAVGGKKAICEHLRAIIDTKRSKSELI